MILESLFVMYNSIWFLINGYNIYPLVKSRVSPAVKSKNDGGNEGYGKNVKTSELPKISVLVPAYHEENVLERCINKLHNSDYPRDKLDLIILTETDDKETSAIAQKCAEKYNVKHLYIEETSEPKGKPRALKQGIKHADGEIVGVIDAEDIIDPKLFRKVAYEIKERGNDAVQGILDMANDKDGWKNLQFRAEYGYWYRHFLPALAKSNFPVPLGGTTNFFKKKVLDDIGDWDAYNLTEDFEIGLRLYNQDPKAPKENKVDLEGIVTDTSDNFPKKYSVAAFNSITKEESPLTWKSWIRQRTRWQRGKIQTMKKVLKNPGKGITKKFNSVMSCITPHIAPVNITGIIICAYAMLNHMSLSPPAAVLAYANLATIPYYCYRQGWGYLKATSNEKIRFKRLKAVMAALTMPVYWAFQWAADLRAIKQEYYDKKIFWEKTEHKGRNYNYVSRHKARAQRGPKKP